MLRHSGRAAAIAALALLAGCSSTLKSVPLNATTGRYETGSLVKAEDVEIKAPFDRAKYGKFAYVKTLGQVQTLNGFFLESVRNTKLFVTVANKDEVERLVIQNKYDGVGDPDSLIALHKLAEAMGPFLVIEPYVEWKGGYDYIASIKVVDPTTTETVFSVKKKAFNWAGLDKPLFYPLFNAMLDWAEGKKVQTEAPPPPAK